MNRSVPFIILLSFFLSLAISCKDLFVPKIEESQKELLVVEGKITNMENFVQIRLTKALGFNVSENNDNISTNAEKGAIVTIHDNDGNKATLQEMGDGYYKSGYFPGYVGRTYTLNIKTLDGNEYESEPETMMSQPESMALTAEFGVKEYLIFDAYGQSSIKNQNGANVFLDVKTSENDKVYYKFNTRKVTETKHVEWRFGRCTMCPATNVYCVAVEELNPIPTITDVNLNNGTREIKHFNLGFIQEAIYDPSDKDEIKDPPTTFGWLLSCTVSRISEHEYLYYSKLRDQLNANSRIFDPLPTQLLSNIKCVNDNSKVVLGYFSVSSTYTIDYFLQYDHNSSTVNYHILNPLPKDISPTCIDNDPPYYWQIN
jgi:hypothetical protein